MIENHFMFSLQVHEGMKLFEFRRGVKRCVTISSLSFSSDSMWLCCSSNTETVHIFKLEEPKETYVDNCAINYPTYIASRDTEIKMLLMSCYVVGQDKLRMKHKVGWAI